MNQHKDDTTKKKTQDKTKTRQEEGREKHKVAVCWYMYDESHDTHAQLVDQEKDDKKKTDSKS